MRKSKYFISYEWDEIDLEGEFYDDEVLLSNTYLNIIHNMPTENKIKFPKKLEIDQASHVTIESKVKWVDQELNHSLATWVPDNYKRPTKSPFVNLGDIDLFQKNFKFYEKSVPISEDDSEDLSSVAVTLNSVKPIRKKDYSVKSKFSSKKITSFKKK